MGVSYVSGTVEDMSCLSEDNYGPITSTESSQSTTTKKPPITRPETEDPDFCSKHKNGLHAHPDCDKYYHCYSNGYQAVQTCAPGLLFNPAVKYCDYAAKVECNTATEETTTEAGTGATTQAGSSTTTTAGQSDDEQEFCTGKKNGYYRHSDKCNKYYHCHAGKTNLYTYGPGLVWNQKTKVCDWPANVNCNEGGSTVETTQSTTQGSSETSTTATATTTESDAGTQTTTQTTPLTTTASQAVEDPQFCKGKKNGYYRHPECNKHYRCQGGKTTITACGPGLVWNQKLKVCDWPRNVNCP